MGPPLVHSPLIIQLGTLAPQLLSLSNDLQRCQWLMRRTWRLNLCDAPRREHLVSDISACLAPVGDHPHRAIPNLDAVRILVPFPVEKDRALLHPDGDKVTRVIEVDEEGVRPGHDRLREFRACHEDETVETGLELDAD